MSDENLEILRRLSNLEHHVMNLIQEMQGTISLFRGQNLYEKLLLLHRDPVLIDDRDLRRDCAELKKYLEECRDLTNLQYIGNRLNEIEKIIKAIQEDGYRKNVHLDITLDGQKLETRTLQKAELEEASEDILKKVFSKLEPKEKKILQLRFGLCGEMPHTQKSIAGKFSVSTARIFEILKRIKRKILKDGALKIPKGQYPDFTKWLYE